MTMKVETKATEMIKPAEKTWTGTMRLSDMDISVSKLFVPKVYVYKSNKEWDPSSISETLKESLSKALVHFYPFLGRLRLTGEGGNRMELHVDDSTADTWGVPVVEAHADVEVADLGCDLLEADLKGRLKSLFWEADVDKPMEEWPLLKLKITHFLCGGVAIGITWSHAVVDGMAAGHFYREWIRFARGESLGEAPVHDRSLVSLVEPHRSVPVIIKQEINKPPSLMQVTTLCLPLSKSQIDKLKQIAGCGMDGRPYTRFEILTAHVWRCAFKAREYEGTKLSGFGIVMDIRKRIDPPLPSTFNGNATITIGATSESEDLSAKPLGYTCGRIKEAIDKVGNDSITQAIEQRGTSMGIMTPEGRIVKQDFLMVSWMNLSFNNLDFGWGNEAHVAIHPMGIEGVGGLLHGHEQGSVMVFLCLQVTHVDKFKYYFFEGLR